MTVIGTCTPNTLQPVEQCRPMSQTVFTAALPQILGLSETESCRERLTLLTAKIGDLREQLSSAIHLKDMMSRELAFADDLIPDNLNQRLAD
ncbi:MAG: hypothetical protein J6K46_00575 [Sutterella sp.]|nr:hypothetical protein [Sutterella sp.]